MEKATLVLVEWREYKRAENYSLGLNYIHAAVAHAGHRVYTIICDGWEAEKAVEAIMQYHPDIVGLKLYAETAPAVFAIAQMIKQAAPRVLTAVGGHTATLHGSLILSREPAIDLVSNGEGEETFVRLCELVKADKSYADCKGIIYRRTDGEIQANPGRNYVEDLDDLTLPDSSIFLGEEQSSDFMTYAISTSRGCVGNCYFCVANHVYEVDGKKRWRGMSAEKVIGEIRKVCNQNPEKRIFVKFLDSSLENPDPVRKERLTAIVNGLETLNRRIRFSFFTRSESWTKEDEKLIIKMKKAGLYQVYMGFDESIHDYPIREFTKKVICGENLTANRLFLDHGIHTTGYLIIFQPFVTLNQLLALAKFIDDIGMSYSPDAWTSEVTLYTDTSLFHDVAAAGLLMGISSDGYSYEYAYEDEAVGRLRDQVCGIKKLQSYGEIRNTLLKVTIEMEAMELSEMKEEKKGLFLEYENQIKAQYKILGTGQKELFAESVYNAMQGTSREGCENIIQRWGTLMSEVQQRLEKLWFQYKVRFLREGMTR